MVDAAETLIIRERFHGPPRSGNGGYVCGVLAGFIGASAEVTLRAPPPLETTLTLVRTGDGVTLHHGEQVVAQARAAQPDVSAPASPGLAEAQRAAARYLGHRGHFFPGCFTCGPAHPQGLHIFTGPADTAPFVAAPWTPGADLAGQDGYVSAEFVWAALDCPTYWALPQAGEIAAVLGRLTGEVRTRPRVGEPHVVAAWPLGGGSRKHAAAAALYNADGEVLALSQALWIEIKPEQFQ